ncbi:MAG: tetratricopeptide repeat protein [Acidobacteriota bacterium]
MTKTFVANKRLVLIVLAVGLMACQSERKSPLFIQMEELAQQGNPEAQYHLGMMYNNGLGVKQDSGKAFSWFSKAADSGEPLASYKLGCYYSGQFGEVQVDAAKSSLYKLIAADAGYSFAQADVGNIYFQKGSYDEAIKWWKLAASQGYPPALGNLSFSFFEGKIIPQDKVLAYAYFKLANVDLAGELTAEAQKGLGTLAEAMTADEIEKAEKIVSDWKAEPTPLTTRATIGMQDAKRVIEESKNKR